MLSRAYFYKLMQLNGKVNIGLAFMAVEKDRSARVWLEKEHRAIVLSLYRLPDGLSAGLAALRAMFKPGLNQKALAGLLRDFAVMNTSGIPFFDVVQEMALDKNPDSDPNAARVCRKLLDDLLSGSSISVAFAKQPEVFPETVCSLAQIGDATGNMGPMLMEASAHLDRIVAMKSVVKQAMIYPAFSFATILGAGAFWIWYVVPNLVGLFKQLNAKLPAFTVAFLAAANWLTENFMTAFAVLSVTVIGCIVLWQKNMKFRRVLYNVALKLPISRTLITSSALAFFAEYLSILVRAGLDVATSLKILEAAIQDIHYKDLVGALREFVKRGDRISTAMRQVGGFPPLMVRMIAAGENAGTLDQQLSYLSTEYAARLKQTVDTLSEIIKPLVIIIAGALFLVLIVALLLPVYDLIKQTMAVR